MVIFELSGVDYPRKLPRLDLQKSKHTGVVPIVANFFFPQKFDHLPKVANFWPLFDHGVFRRKELQMRQFMVI